MNAQTPMAARIETKLTESLAPESLEVVDESAMHEGHAGARPGGQTHFRVHIVARAFEGQSRIERQKSVYRVLREEMADSVHALALTTRTPAEESGQ